MFGPLLPSPCVGGLSRLRSEAEPLRRRRLARDWGDAASQVRLMMHMADKRRHEEAEKGGKLP